MATAQVEATKAYIAKHNLEDNMSAAVNAAIKVDAEDPYVVIIEHLKQFVTTEDYDDDDDDVMQEGEEPVVRPPAGRRNQVVAKKFEVPDNWVAPVHEKSAEATAFLNEVMSTNKLMKNLSPSDKESLVKAFEEQPFDEGSAIITQGDAGDSFYVLYDGTCDISITGKGSVMKATKGIAFGELALLHGAPRAATVVAEGPVKTFKLDEVSFKMILMGKATEDHKSATEFLKTVPILASASPEDIQTLAGSLKEEAFDAGKSIIVEGDEGATFYIVKSGEVKFTKVGSSEEVNKRGTAGSFFGELALMKNDKRAATVTATERTIVLSVTRAMFDRMLGPIVVPPNYSGQ